MKQLCAQKIAIIIISANIKLETKHTTKATTKRYLNYQTVMKQLKE